MLVYGDQREFVSPEDQARIINEQLDLAAGLPRRLERHVAIVSALIEAGRLLQGIADADFAEVGQDHPTPATTALSEFLVRLGQAVVRSWETGFARVLEIPKLPRLIGVPSRLELRQPEGYSFYAVYPEAYIQAARRLALIAPPRVIAIRSIGTSLGAVVAAALRAPAPITVRPFGDPFARRIAIAPEVERDLLATEAHFIIVDEGPGQSGSSFGAVGDWLQERGVPLDRIAFVPSHAGALGPQASAAHGHRWKCAQRVAADLGEAQPELLTGWIEPLVGALDGPLVELSGGEWRRHVFAGEEQWPAVQPGWERRKFLARASGSRFFIKFAGLGAIGERKQSMARALHVAGCVPEPIGLAHGFLVERWCEQALPLAAGEEPIADVARYLGTRARLFPAGEGSGASLDLLHEMTVRNLSIALGDEAAQAFAREWGRLDELRHRAVRVRTDNKLDPHEWLRTGKGRLLKTDALDHHCAHDLIGCQDLAWDVAGAISEFRLGRTQADQLIHLAEQAAGRKLNRELLHFYRLAYAAFRRGQLAMVEAGDAEEAFRLTASATRYDAELQQLLAVREFATRQESWVE